MELLSNFFHGSPFRLGPLPFPDFSHITIVRPNAMGITHKRIPINLLNSTNGVDCSEDVPLDFGDVVEVPEREHTLAEDDTLTGKLTEEMSQCLKEKAGTASLIVDGGQTIQLPLNEFEPGDCSVQDLLGSDSAMKVLTSDSDLSHVKVTRGQKTWITDCSGRSPIPGRMPSRQINFGNRDYSDLWVRDGDVIEVPETH